MFVSSSRYSHCKGEWDPKGGCQGETKQVTVGGTSLERQYAAHSISPKPRCVDNDALCGDRCDSFRILHELHNSPAAWASSEHLH